MRRLLAAPGAVAVRICAVADASADRLAAGQSAFGCPGYADLDRMLAAVELDAVALFTGPNGRAGLIRKIIRAGKDVMTTKPFELDPIAARTVLAEAAAAGRTVFLNSPAPVLGQDLQQILEWQRTENLGRLIFAQADCWYRNIEQADGSWYDDPVLCPAAPIFRLGIYGINDLVALADDLVELQVNLAGVLTGRPTPDVAQLSLRFANGTMAFVRATWCCEPIRDNQVSEFVFEHGTVRRDYGSRDHRNAEDTTLLLDAVNAGGELYQKHARISNRLVNSAYRWDLFVRAVRGERIPGLIGADRIVAGVEIMHTLTQALRQGGGWRKPDPAAARPA
jgi:predicted dehydrogenase